MDVLPHLATLGNISWRDLLDLACVCMCACVACVCVRAWDCVCAVAPRVMTAGGCCPWPTVAPTPTSPSSSSPSSRAHTWTANTPCLASEWTRRSGTLRFANHGPFVLLLNLLCVHCARTRVPCGKSTCKGPLTKPALVHQVAAMISFCCQNHARTASPAAPSKRARRDLCPLRFLAAFSR